MNNKLHEIEKFAGLGMPPKEIEIIVELEEGTILNNLNRNHTPEAKAYLKGKLLLKAELNKSIITLAKQGSGPAQTMLKNLINTQNAEEVDHE
jgi:hypothetical protein